MRTEPTLLFVVGPPAVGKLTVGSEVARRTGFRVLHNHLTLDLVHRFFPWGVPPFWELVGEFRQRLLEELAATSLPGVVFTYCWAFNQPEEEETVNRYVAPFRSRGLPVYFVELLATQEERLKRNATPFRLQEKPSNRDLAASRARLLETDRQWLLDSQGRFDGRADWLRLDTTDLSAFAAADRVMRHFELEERLSPPAGGS